MTKRPKIYDGTTKKDPKICQTCGKFPRIQFMEECQVCDAIRRSAMDLWLAENKVFLEVKRNVNVRIEYAPAVYTYPMFHFKCRRCKEEIHFTTIVIDDKITKLRDPLPEHELEDCFSNLLERIRTLERKFNF